MRRMMICVGMSIGLLGMGMIGCAQDGAKKLAVSEVPPTIMSPVQARFPGAQIINIEREKEDGKVVYDFELTHNGRKYEMDIKDDGTVTEIEKQVDAANVPAAVTTGVMAKYPGSTIGEVMEVNLVSGSTEKPDHYEVTLTKSGKETEVVVSLDGSKVTEEAEESQTGAK